MGELGFCCICMAAKMYGVCFSNYLSLRLSFLIFLYIIDTSGNKLMSKQQPVFFNFCAAWPFILWPRKLQRPEETTPGCSCNTSDSIIAICQFFSSFQKILIFLQNLSQCLFVLDITTNYVNIPYVIVYGPINTQF